MVIIAIMEKTGWSYTQYMETPVHILELIKEKMKVDVKKSNKK